MNIRKNIYSLSDSQLQDLKDALNAVKADGTYDTFIERHHHAMSTATPWGGEATDEDIRNVAHRGPAFLPWHRYFCRELELALQAKRPNCTLPYWDWAADAANPLGAALWNTNAAQRIYIGGDGTGPGGTVDTGPFANWTALIEGMGGSLVPRPGGIIRELGDETFGNPDFPTSQQVTDAVQTMTVYDTSPWRMGSTNSFRNRLEGWLALGGESSSQLHNRVHMWVGGDMGPGTSPNDPVFFLHHCNVDRLWALWQYAHPASPYAPASGGPVGHNLNDVMQHLTTASASPAASIDYRRTMGFIYDTDPPLVDLMTPVVSFQDVPTLETSWRAAVFHVRAGSTVHLDIVPGSGPSAPYSVTALGSSVTHIPPVDSAPYDSVRVWFAFTGAVAPGAAPGGSVQIRCVETNQVFNVALTGNTVARPTTGVVFCLDRSGSMGLPAGTGGTRMQLLHEAASRCVELMRDGSGAGVVSFNHDAYPGQPLAVFQAASTHRADVLTAVTGLSPGGGTSIGDGVELARTTLNAGAAPFQGQAIVVLTDGLENQPKSLDQVAGSIDTRTFGIGLGTAQQVSTEALAKIAHATSGYILLTGPLTSDTDSYFLLSKYFQQILVTATNEDIVTDPSGFLSGGQVVRIPFDLAESDIDATIVLLVDVSAVRLAIETPGGALLSAAKLATLGAKVTRGTNMTYCRVGLPLPVGAGAHGGTWHAVLTVDEPRLKRELTRLRRATRDRSTIAAEAERLNAHGIRYSVTVSSWSNLRMSARLTQTSFKPGARLRLDVALTEYGQPVGGRVRVDADVLRPNGVRLTLPLAEETAGAFGGEMVANLDGIWRVRVRARGRTLGGIAFTREQLLSAAVMVGGEAPPLGPRDDHASLEDLLRCLVRQPGWQKWLKDHGIDWARLRECLENRAKLDDPRELDLLG
jgi:Common central domain of tyrosinase/von Willebrand factor type A domain